MNEAATPQPLEIAQSLINFDGSLVKLAEREIVERIGWIIHLLSSGREGDNPPPIILRDGELPF